MSVAHAAPADHEMVLAAELFVISSGSGPKVSWEVDQGPELGFYATGVSELVHALPLRGLGGARDLYNNQ